MVSKPSENPAPQEDNQASDTFIVKGHLQYPNQVPFTSGIVRAFDTELKCEDRLLGKESTIDPKGNYEITYTRDQLCLPHKASADLVVRVFADPKAADPIAESPTISVDPTARETTVDLTIRHKDYPGPSEYERFMETVIPYIAHIQVSKLKHPTPIDQLATLTDERSKVFLARKTQIALSDIHNLVTAAKLSKETKLAPELHYGLLKQGLPPDLPTLVTQPPESAKRALTNALDHNLIPPRFKEEVETIPERLTALKVEQPTFLLNPAVLFGNLEDLSRLENKAADFAASKLNAHLRAEIFNRMGSVSEALTAALQPTVAALDYRNHADTPISTVITDTLLSKVKADATLAAEIAEVETRLTERSAETIGEVLHLNSPLKENPVFGPDIRKVKVLEYAKLANLDEGTANNLVAKSLDPKFIRDADLTDLVKEGIIQEEEKPELKLIFDLAKLTGDNLPLIRALKGPNLLETEGLISWEKADWQRLITDAAIPLPLGVKNAETYADTMVFNLAVTYPTQFLLDRFLKPQSIRRINHLDTLNGLLGHNERLIEGRSPAKLDWRGVDSGRIDGLEANLKELTRFANTYRHLGIPDLINDKDLSLESKKTAITHQVNLIETFYRNNPNIDLRFINFFDSNDESLNWADILPDDQPSVRHQMMAWQRALSLTDLPMDAQTLLGNGYDNIWAIVGTPEDEFVYKSGLGGGASRKVMNDAHSKVEEIALSEAAIFDMRFGGLKEVRLGNIPPALFNDLREIDGLEELFGPQRYCYCEDCKSILSPAAYFVDLMAFIEDYVSTPVFITPGQATHSLYLKNRRQDLWTLNLTCENTHRLVPYLTIVNEVLEAFLRKSLGTDVFEAFSQAQISFSLPFNLALEELRLYLGHFGLSLYDIYRLLNQDDKKVWRARLNLSEEEYTVITTDGSRGVRARLGNPSSIENFNVQDFIRFVGITRQQLDEVLRITYHPGINPITIENLPRTDDIQDFDEVLQNLTVANLDFIHRFIRLWKKTPWSIPELHDLLLELGQAKWGIRPDESQITPRVVQCVAQLVDIQATLGLTAEELCAVVHQLPVSDAFPAPPVKESDRRLFERLFDVQKLFTGSSTATTFHHYSLNTNNLEDQEIDPKTPILLGGLGVTETELLLLFDLLHQEMPFDQNGNCPLNRAKISLLYRHARLAKALKYSIEDFIRVLHLNFQASDRVIKRLDPIRQLIAFKTWQKSSPFSPAALQLILQGLESPTAKYQVTLSTASLLVQDVQKIQTDDAIKALKALKELVAKSFNISVQHLENYVLEWVATDIDGTDIQTALAAHFTNEEPDNPDDLAGLLALLREIERILLVFSSLKFKEETIQFLTENSILLGITNCKALTLQNLQALTFYQKPITLAEDAEASVQSILEDYKSTFPYFSAGSITRLADLWEQDPSLIESLHRSLTLPSVPIEALKYLEECLHLCQTLGLNGYSLQNLAEDGDYDALTKARDIALGAFSSKYDDETIRAEKLEPYHDRINVKKRDALCDYILARQDYRFNDLNEVYAFFLLDVEMSGCFRTSRLVCGISSLQLYIHRCLVNLEQSATDPDLKIDPTLIPANEWEWRKNYRVWEANRKVFLYPENYLEPDLRDNKTPIFKELEDELLQQKITKEAAEAAYTKYLTQFSELARLRIAGSYYHAESQTYYFFGRTQQDPYQYYYRKWTNSKVWTPWEKIDLAINSEYVAAIVRMGKLFVFWVEIRTQEEEDGTKYKYSVDLLYSWKEGDGKWISPQRLELSSHFWDTSQKEDYTSSKYYKKLYPKLTKNQEINFSFPDFYRRNVGIKINFFMNSLERDTPQDSSERYSYYLALVKYDDEKKAVIMGAGIYQGDRNHDLTRIKQEIPYSSSNILLTNRFNDNICQSDIDIVHNRPGDYVVKLADKQYLIRRTQFCEDVNLAIRETFQLTVSLLDSFESKLFKEGVENFLALDTQRLTENLPDGVDFTEPLQLSPPVLNTEHLDFEGAYGTYYSELFFHIPFLIANHLNANQRFKEAKWWYERIFDPTASETPALDNPTDRNWRYIEFRGQTLEKLKDILTNSAAIQEYKENPFSPFAIARLRMRAFQKAVVMKYIDNLLDWGDYLFAQDTMESINEATMLYVLDSDILGERPPQLGSCPLAPDEVLTYDKIGPALKEGSEFLIMLESWYTTTKYEVARKEIETLITSSSSSGASGNGLSLISSRSVEEHDTILKRKEEHDKTISYWENGKSIEKHPSASATKQKFIKIKQTNPAFCVPPNYELLKYWDRVEDRLFKIRHCMNISGVRRQLALFQPPINPMLLVRARAAGLSIEDIVAGTTSMPPYRFSYLIEKAKQFSQTVQSFGSALLSALEKKDVEELTLLRSTHEREILQMTKAVKQQQIKDAEYQYQAMVETEANVQYRVNYYQGLIDDGLTSWEFTQQISRHTASILQVGDGVLRLYAGISYLIPQIGSPFAMKYGGKEFGDSASAFAEMVASAVKIAEAVSASAGLEATFQRREQEWNHQLTLAQQELKQVEQQKLAAEVRQEIAKKDLEIHETSMEQADEVYDFYKNKFTSLGLYNYLATTLNRLYREAYNVAHELALMAEKAYLFERDDETPYILPDNWQLDRAGLLAGERLLLQLQRMEKAYLEKHTRDYEITQSFSLALLNPAELVKLRATGTCDLTIPEIIFDLFYPGQYKRLIKSVRLTIPCVTGQYTNVSAKLTLTKGEFRKEASLESSLEERLFGKNPSISTSSANNDAGMFELNFRDERYLPFEGAGAISQWKLELPSKLRPFDYDTISDVIIHLSYTAKEDGGFRTTVEDDIATTLTNFAQANGLYRLLSLKHEFPAAFHRLLHPAGATQTAEFDIGRQHFPYFLADKTLTISNVTVYLKPKGKDPVATTGLTLEVNGVTCSGWSLLDTTNLEEANVPFSGNPIRTWAIEAADLDPEEISDILILLKYIVSNIAPT